MPWGGNPRLIESFLRAVTSSPASVGDLLEALERGEGLSELFLGVWDELQPDARALLSACAYLRGQAVVAQLEVACELERSEVSAGLTELMRVGLATVVRSAGRPDVFSCSSAVARFVIAEAPEQLVAVFTERLSAYYIRQFSREPENAAWAVVHVAGIMAVLQWTYDRGDDALLQALFSSLFDDRIAAGRLAYESAVRAGNYRAASLATDVLSSTHAARGELDSALEAVALGLVAAERSMDVGERARQMRAHALALYKGGDAAAALAALEGADDLARQTGDLEILVNVLGLRTVACWWLDAVEDCAAAAEEGLRVCEEMAWQRASAYPLRNLAELAVHRGRFDRAETLLEQARAIAESFGDRRQLARIHLTSARMALFAGQPKRAAEEASLAHSAAVALGLLAELREAHAIGVAAAWSRGLHQALGAVRARVAVDPLVSAVEPQLV
jgi:tetratricopeptide (TPR) repeat protein